MKKINKIFGSELYTKETEIIQHSIGEDGSIYCPICSCLLYDVEDESEELKVCDHVELIKYGDYDLIDNGVDLYHDSLKPLFEGIGNLHEMLKKSIREHDSSLSNLTDTCGIRFREIGFDGSEALFLPEWSRGNSYENMIMAMLSVDKNRIFMEVDEGEETNLLISFNNVPCTIDKKVNIV